MNALEKLYESYQLDPAFEHLREIPGNRFVGGSGPNQADLMLIGEAPGRLENALKYPFVGSAGTVLNSILAEIGIDRKDVFITNAVKYWPRDEKGKTRKPTEEELTNSRSYCQKELAIVDPRIIGLLGKSPYQMWFGFKSKDSISNLSGRLLGNHFVPVYHPAVVVYRPEMREVVMHGYRALEEYLND